MEEINILKEIGKKKLSCSNIFITVIKQKKNELKKKKL